MLNYIATVTEDLVVVVLLITMLYAFFNIMYGHRGRRSQKIGIAVGLLASAAMAVAKNVTSKIATNRWNLYIFYVGIAAALIFVIFSLVSMRRKHSGLTAAEVISHLSGAILTADLIFYEAPDVMAYPFKFETLGSGVFSIAYLVRLIGWLLPLILLYVTARCLYQSILTLGSVRLLSVSLYLALAVNAFRFAGLILGKWLAKPKWLTWPVFRSADHPWAFPFAKFVSNNTLFFIVITEVIALLIPIILASRSIRVTQPYENSAQRRKLIAANRRCRRRTGVIVLCAAVFAVNLTVIKAYISQEVELSEPETYEIEDDKILISLEQLADGHLHRYEYTTDDQVDVRWIIIKKPGSGAYGVGLDACNVCGIAGYFERDGQVVCKRCDVVMNINTIGFQGGCNPIPLEYTVENGSIVIPLQAVIDGKKKFE
ncbi:MAG: Fe-S-containing protein [Lachnospiraceae bacterium]|nr:Fe-S-containing protein [Lachnospiraceae bacterium]